jgi:hypothetical protein
MSTTDTSDANAELTNVADCDYRTVHERGCVDPLSVTVVKAVAEALDAEPLEIDPLFVAVDPDALDELFASNRSDGSLECSFRYEGCTVSVRSDGEVRVSARDD